MAGHVGKFLSISGAARVTVLSGGMVFSLVISSFFIQCVRQVIGQHLNMSLYDQVHAEPMVFPLASAGLCYQCSNNYQMLAGVSIMVSMISITHAYHQHVSIIIVTLTCDISI